MSTDPTRQLLLAVVDALTLPYGVPDYDQRILARGAEARSVAAAALTEDPADLDWNTAYLRRKLAAEETAAAEREKTRCQRCLRDFDLADTRFDGHARHKDSPWCRWCVDRCHESTDAFHVCRICDPARYGGGAR